MAMAICIFEDEHCNRLYPLTLTRPVFELRCGIAALREKIARQFSNSPVFLFCRNYLAEALREGLPEARVNEIPPEDCLFINGRFMMDGKAPAFAEPVMAWKNNGEIAAARLTPALRASLAHLQDGVIPTSFFADLPVAEIEGVFIRYLWDLVHHNSAQIKSDFAFCNRGGQQLGKIYPRVALLEEQNICIAAGARIKPGVVLDAEDGPIFIDEGATIMANASLQGPLYVGAHSAIKMGAKIYPGTSIGPVCKVGGEVEDSIIHACSNKQHEGFLGHAYLGEWVNLGADSNNSDLKNNYSAVKVYVDGQMVDSGSMFVGLFMGDHAKCGINTMFNTGTVVGVMSNLFGAGYLDKFVPSFAWSSADSWQTYTLDKALETARRVMQRRKRDLTWAQESVLRRVFELTAAEREAGRAQK